MRYDQFPAWTICRLADEIEACHFIPTVKTVKRWLAVLGISARKEIASALRTGALSYLIIVKKESAADGGGLLVSPQIACCYQDWRKRCGYDHNAEALNALLSEFFSEEPQQHMEQEVINPNTNLVMPITGLSNPFTQTELARRLGTTNSMLSRRRTQTNFHRWSQLHDPEGTQWEWVPRMKKYFPKAQE